MLKDFINKEIAKLSKNVDEVSVFAEEVEAFDSTFMIALSSLVFTQAASLAYSKLAQALPENPELINGLAMLKKEEVLF